MTSQRKSKIDPIEDAVATWLFQRYDERLKRGRAAHEWHGDARGLLAEIKRATNVQSGAAAPQGQPEYRLTLGELLRMREESETETCP